MTPPRVGLAIVVVALALASAAPQVHAQAASAKQQAADGTSPNAFVLRDDIARRIGAGESAAAVKADLVRQYGPEILGAPPAEGWGWLAWLVPARLDDELRDLD